MFDRVYCIHLPNAERRAKIDAQLQVLNLPVTYVHAAPPPSGFAMSNMRRAPAAEFGANLSHIKAVAMAMADGAQRPLFVEDDVSFKADLGALAELPDDWEVVYLGGHPREPVLPYSERLVRVGRFSFAEAYSIRGGKLLEFFSLWCDRIGKPHAMFDFILGEFAAANNAFCTYPLVTEQLPNVSQISGKMDDKRDLVRRGWAANLSTKSA